MYNLKNTVKSPTRYLHYRKLKMECPCSFTMFKLEYSILYY